MKKGKIEIRVNHSCIHMTNNVVKFKAHGHPNMRAMHRLTLEFTKDTDLTPRGDCIIGIGADFSLDEIRRKILAHSHFRMIISVGDFSRLVTAKTNPEFCSNHEIVVRLGHFLSDRTLGTDANVCAKDFLPVVELMKNISQEIVVEIEPLDKGDKE